MMMSSLKIKNKTIRDLNKKRITGKICYMDDQEFYCIRNVDRMAPFLTSVTSSDNHWMYISSRGGLTAGRVNEEGCLFPYETEDKLHCAHTHTGPVTVIRFPITEESTAIWSPFSNSFHHVKIHRNIYKNCSGNHIIFEEINQELGLVFRYSWQTSNTYGFVRTASIENVSDHPAAIDLLDGMRNIIPHGLELQTIQSMSNLSDAYKYSEVDKKTGLAIYSLASLLMDQPRPGESLKASVVWSRGFDDCRIYLCEESIQRFINGEKIEDLNPLTGRRGAYLINESMTIESGSKVSWTIVADVNKDQSSIIALKKEITSENGIVDKLSNSISESSNQLILNVASSDGLQKTNNQVNDYHHFSNVLFNIMRGGVFHNNYSINTPDLINFIETRNKNCYLRHRTLLGGFPQIVQYPELIRRAEGIGDFNLIRLCYEYVPIMFSRRHGDPSRPWNRFDIHIKDGSGNKILNYQGNWRDIFQNWEALCYSFPEYIESIVAKFVNASTIDGFNPYRITRNGIDWEKEDPQNSWVYIGYWGDHQIIYLLKLLEVSKRFHPDKLVGLLDKSIFSYSNVPYRIKSFDQIVKDSKHTIFIDFELDRQIESSITAFGTDARLLLDKNNEVYHVTLMEKLIVPLLSKLSNMIPDGGIWLNTQRPEWNDANNALVGNGTSMVTLYYLYRYVNFLTTVISDITSSEFRVSVEVVTWLTSISEILQCYQSHLGKPKFTDQVRRQIINELGITFSDFRNNVYKHGFSGKCNLSKKEVIKLLEISGKYLEHAISANRCDTGLYQAYNLLHIHSDSNTASVSHLYEMLEGQVAVLSSGVLSPKFALQNLKALFESKMYRKDQNSFMLYPVKTLPGFLEKNIINPDFISNSPLLTELVQSGNKEIIIQDVEGNYRFNSSFRNKYDLIAALQSMTEQKVMNLVKSNLNAVLEVYEKVFNHHSFTGRSGSMYAYEGIGSIYWHMVAKLLLAVQEYCFRTENSSSHQIRNEFYQYYYKLRDGLGFNKSPEEYGAFPFDPYSHTPAHSGARQPGMTGQVKEEILTRFGELGIDPDQGRISFTPKLLRKEEFLLKPFIWQYYNLEGKKCQIRLEKGSLAFTYCQVPVIYKLTENEHRITVDLGDERITFDGSTLSEEVSQHLIRRTGHIRLISVSIPESFLML